jgi:tetratricopeptide (TPR) repeat protein
LKDLGNRKSASAALHNVGSAYRTIGDLDKALEYVAQSRKGSEEIDYIPNLAGAITTTGIILHQKGRLEEAASYLDESISMFKDIRHKVYLARALYHAIIVAVDQEKLEKAENLLEEMRSIDDTLDSLLINQHYRVARALWLKEKGNETDLEEAQNLFQQVVNEKITFFEVTFLSLLSLCDLLVDQLRETGQEQIMNSLKEYTDMALELAKNQGSHWLEAETYCLQAQIALIEFEYENAKTLLTRAQLIADDKGLNQLARRISNEFDELLKQEEKWTELTISDAPIAERVDVAQIDERVGRMSRIKEAAASQDEEDQPIQFMLMAAHGGFCIASKEFQTAFKVDESLVSGFLTAITSFSDEVFDSPLDRIKVGDYIILFRAILPFLFCYVFKGESYTALKKVDRIISELKENQTLWSSLENTVESGLLDTSTTRQVEELVTEIFEYAI